MTGPISLNPFRAGEPPPPVGAARDPIKSHSTIVGGVRVTTCSRRQLADLMASDCRKVREGGGPARLIFDLNGHALSLREYDHQYRQALARADLVHADGGFIVTVSKWLAGVPISERSATTDLIDDFAARAVKEGLSFYLLGGTEEMNAECAQILQHRYPGLRIVGRRNGYFVREQEEEIVAGINTADADIVWVGLGKPKEQLFCAEHRDRLKVGWLVTCGGCFTFVTGRQKRAPAWMQKANLEWLFRMINDPGRLFWRYLITTPHALLLALMRTPLHQGSRAIHD